MKQGNDQTAVHENLKPEDTPDTPNIPKNKSKHVNLLMLWAILMFGAGVNIINSGGILNELKPLIEHKSIQDDDSLD